MQSPEDVNLKTRLMNIKYNKHDDTPDLTTESWHAGIIKEGLTTYYPDLHVCVNQSHYQSVLSLLVTRARPLEQRIIITIYYIM